MKPLLLSLSIFFVFNSYMGAQAFTEHAIPTRTIAGNLCVSPDNLYVYFTANTTIGRIAMDGSITEFDVPPAGPNAMKLVGCSFSPKGILYFGDQNNYAIYAYSPKAQVFVHHALPPPNIGMAGVQFHSDWLLYIMVSGSSAIQRMQRDGTFLPAIQLAADRYPHGPSSCGGNVWFAENTANRVAFVTTSGAVSEFDIPEPATQPFSTICAPDGGVYFTLNAANKIGRIDTTTQEITTWPIPTANSMPKGISLSSTGVCFAESNVNKIGCMPLMGGPMTEDPVPVRGSAPNKLVYGPDGGIWFSQAEVSYVASFR
jgi:streptogramin lyase